MKVRRICTRADDLSKSQAKELRSKIAKTVKDFNQEIESKDSEVDE